MAEPKLISTGDVPLDVIDTAGRMRPVSDAAVAALIASIETIGGMKDEIHVRKMRGGKFRLIAGGHRCAAAAKLGWATVPAKVWDCTAAYAQLLEIDDNLAHAELAPLDLAFFLAERKRVYEKEFPQATRGGDRGNQHTGGRQTDIMSFCQSVAEQRGMSDRHVRRILAAGERLEATDVATLRKSERPITLKDLQDLAKVGDPEQRSDACRQISTGYAKSVKAALSDPKPHVPDDEKKFAALLSAWDRAPMSVRRRFIEDRPEVSLLTAKGGEK